MLLTLGGSSQLHMKRIVSGVKLSFEEFTTVLSQIEPASIADLLCLFHVMIHGADALTPGHFIIGRPTRLIIFFPISHLAAAMASLSGTRAPLLGALVLVTKVACLLPAELFEQ